MLSLMEKREKNLPPKSLRDYIANLCLEDINQIEQNRRNKVRARKIKNSRIYV